MAGMIYELMSGLKNEIELYDMLYELALEKRTQLIKGDVPKINEINIKEENVVTQLKGCERLRKQLMSDIATVLNVKPSEATLTKIEEALEKQPEESASLAEIKKSLKISLERLRVINNDNMSLINQSLDYAQFSLNVLQSSMDGPALTSNYGSDDDNRGSSFFDAKQ